MVLLVQPTVEAASSSSRRVGVVVDEDRGDEMMNDGGDGYKDPEHLSPPEFPVQWHAVGLFNATCSSRSSSESSLNH